MTIQAFALCLVLSLPLGATTTIQDSDLANDRELAGLVEEQSNLIRLLARLRGTMQVLLDRIEAEGRTRTAELLREAIQRLDARQAEAAGGEGLTMAETMERARAAMSDGRLVQSIERQSKLATELEGLLDILMDRQSLDRLEDKLNEVRDLRKQVEQLAGREDQLKRDTQKLREQSANDAQRNLEAKLKQLAEQEAERLRATEAAARANGAFELEALERELSELLSDQRVDEQVLGSWNPERDPAWEQATQALNEALNAEGQRRQEASVAQELQRQADALQQGKATPAEAEQNLAGRAEELRRDARVSPSESRDAQAQAAEAALEALRDAQRSNATPQEAAEALRQAAQGLTERESANTERAQTERAEAGEALNQLAQTETSEADRELAQDLQAELERADTLEAAGAEDESALALANTARAMNRANQDRQTLAEALAGSQESQAARTERMERALEALPETATSAEAKSEAGEALQRASEAMRKASAQARSADEQAATKSAQEAREALEEALEKISEGTEASNEAAQEALAEMAQAEREAAEATESLAQSVSQGSMSPEAQARTEEAMQRAQEAMQEAAESMSKGQPAAAAEAQREATEALRDAQREASEGVEPQSPADQQRAQELAEEQAQIQEEILNLAQRIRDEEEQERDPENLDRAAEQAEQAEQALQEGDLSEAEQREEETERELRQMQEDLEEEEEQYQQLRQEELLFRLAEELEGLMESHEAQIEALSTLHGERAADRAPSRSQRLRLRRLAREESALATRSAEMATAIEAEGSLVSASLLRSAQSDLERIALALSEKGDFETGARTQALQRDVRETFEWILGALQDEIERRQEEESEQSESEPPEEGQNKENLVPDIAELKLLRRMEIEIQDDVKQIRLLYPDLGETEFVDEFALMDLTRLASKSQDMAELFQSMRERLGITKEDPTPPPQDTENTSGETK